MTELLPNQDPWEENERHKDGLIKVIADDESVVWLQQAKVESVEIDFNGITIPYEGLINRTGYKLRPYTIFASRLALLDFGDSIIEVSSAYEDTFGVRSKQHLDNLKFLDTVRSIDMADENDRLTVQVSGQAWDDASNYSVDLHRLQESGIDTWVRLEYRKASTIAEIVVAKLVRLDADHKHQQMIPIVNTHDAKAELAIPQSLTFGEPWLYIGSKTTDS